MWFKLSSAPDGWVICDGSNGTPNLIGKYPLGATSKIGSEVEAGLPNITGYALSLESIGNCGGAFGSKSNSASGVGANDWGYHQGIDFDASRCSKIYGKSSTVTPPSVKLLPCMKV